MKWLKPMALGLSPWLIAASCSPSLGDWYPSDINDSGAAVGGRTVVEYDANGFGTARGFAVLYRKDQPLVSLPSLNSGEQCSARAIANDGTIVGSCGLNA